MLVPALLAVCVASARAQGLVQFKNYVPSTTPSIDAPVYLDEVGGTKLDSAYASTFRAALIGGPTTSQPAVLDFWNNIYIVGNLAMTYHPANTALTWVGFRSGTGVNGAGYVNTGSSAARVVPGVDAGAPAIVQLVVWSGAADTWMGAFVAAQSDPTVKLGVSNPLTLVLSSPAGDPTYLWGLQPIAMHVPEPNALVLSALAALLLGGRYLKGGR